jgi:hypothetical protein
MTTPIKSSQTLFNFFSSPISQPSLPEATTLTSVLERNPKKLKYDEAIVNKKDERKSLCKLDLSTGSLSSYKSFPFKPSLKSSQTTERYSWLVDIKDRNQKRPLDEGYDPTTLYIPSQAWSKFTSFERQYWEIKKDNWDTIVFFKKGKFYELYEKDAEIGQKEFDLKLTERVNMKMVGVPEKTFVPWASKFIGLGYKVAKVDEMESGLQKSMREKEQNIKSKEKVINRELKCIITAGTLLGDMVVDEMSTYIMSIKYFLY